MTEDDDPAADALPGTEAGLRALFRYQRSGEVRAYHLKILAIGVELWRVTERPGQPPASLKEADLTSAAEAAQLLDDIQRSLTAGGWRECPTDHEP
jgi:hypothetical protein